MKLHGPGRGSEGAWSRNVMGRDGRVKWAVEANEGDVHRLIFL